MDARFSLASTAALIADPGRAASARPFSKEVSMAALPGSAIRAAVDARENLASIAIG